MGKKSTSAALRLEDLPKEAEIENDMIGASESGETGASSSG